MWLVFTLFAFDVDGIAPVSFGKIQKFMDGFDVGDAVGHDYSPVQRYSKQLGIEIRAIVEQDIAHLPDVLVPTQVSALLGYDLREIYDWGETRGLKALNLSGKLYYPKQFLLDFVSSKAYHNIREKSKEHIELLRRVLHE